jgi:hypothetical protein
MADGIKADFSEWNDAAAKLAGPLKVSLARSIAVGMGEVLRDEAKRWAPKESGRLQESIYLAFKDGLSDESKVVYSVSWNHSLAPHGHWMEFGHWQPYQIVYNDKLGHFQTLAKGKGGGANAKLRKHGPKWVAAKPFLRPAYDIAGTLALKAGIERGRKRLPELLREADGHRSDAENDA